MTRAPLFPLIAALALAACSNAPPDPTGYTFSRLGSLQSDATHKTGGLNIDWVALLKELGSSDSTGGTR